MCRNFTVVTFFLVLGDFHQLPLSCKGNQYTSKSGGEEIRHHQVENLIKGRFSPSGEIPHTGNQYVNVGVGEIPHNQNSHGGDRRSVEFSSGENHHLIIDSSTAAFAHCEAKNMKTRAEVAKEHGISPDKVRSAVEVGRVID